MDRRAHNVNYQKRAEQFSVGDSVLPFNGNVSPAHSGTVVAVHPGIGMVDVEFPNGNKRYPVEDLILLREEAVLAQPLESSNVPGGLANRVASAYYHGKIKKNALYWSGANRRYRLTKREKENGHKSCPKCKTDMGQTIYKREDSKSVRLLVCPNCLFCIRYSDVDGLE
jgi:hypothetical protein